MDASDNNNQQSFHQALSIFSDLGLSLAFLQHHLYLLELYIYDVHMGGRWQGLEPCHLFTDSTVFKQ